MVIECTECRSRFRMADDKLKPGGTKVRCTKCKQIFTVHPPAAIEEPTLFADPAEPGSSAPPTPERQEQETREEFSFDATPATPSAASEPQTQEQNDDFSADGFSAGFSFEIEDPSTTADEDTFSLGTSGGGDSHRAEPSFAFGTGDRAEPSFAFDDRDTDSSLGFDDTASSLSLNSADQRNDGGDGGQQSGGYSAFADNNTDQEAPGAGSFDFSLEDSGDYSWQVKQRAADEPPVEEEEADHFDFSKMTFGESDESEAEEASPRSAPLFTPRAEVFAAPASAAEFHEMAGAEHYDDQPFSNRPARRSSPWAAFLLLVLLIIGGGAGYVYWIDGTFDLDRIVARFGGKQPQTLPPGQVRLADLNGGFVEHKQLGQLFVIQGKTINDFQETRSAIAVKGILYNEAGKPLLQQTAFAGNPLDETALRTLPLDKIEERMNNQFGDSLSNLNIAPGKSIPFTIVFKNLPTDLAEFTVEVVDSKPVSN